MSTDTIEQRDRRLDREATAVWRDRTDPDEQFAQQTDISAVTDALQTLRESAATE